MTVANLIGQRFGELTVIKKVENVNHHSGWLCQCSCGKQTIAPTHKLRGGQIVSCGHLKADVEYTGLRRGYQNKKKNGVATFLLDDKRKIRNDNKSGVTGIKLKELKNGDVHYIAQITIKGKRHHLGTFSTLKEAVEAHKEFKDAFFNSLDD